MSRIRNVKPDFFRHEGLQDLERENAGKYPMFVFQGLWTKCDRQGVFEWRPRTLKLDILPFLDFKMEDTLKILEKAGFIKKYAIDGKEYGFISTFSKHQVISIAEEKNKNVFPMPRDVETVDEPFQNGSETVDEPFQNPGERRTDIRRMENGYTDAGGGETEYSDAKMLFLYLWQHNPDVFNSLARIESPKEFQRWWSTGPPSCEEVRRVIQNVIDDVNCGVLERRYIASTPDRFVLGGGFVRHKTRSGQGCNSSSPNIAEKKSLGDLDVC
jgi:hypothetical protein